MSTNLCTWKERFYWSI